MKSQTQARIIVVILGITYLPFMLVLVGLSAWWFRTTSDPENPVLYLLWWLLRALPGIIGFLWLVMGPILLFEWQDAIWVKRVLELRRKLGV